MPAAEGQAQRGSGTLVLALIVGQLGLHSAMAGLRLAASLQLLREGYSAWSVGLLLALFAAAPVLMALHAGRMADRHGYHRPVYSASLISVLGMGAAVASTMAAGPWHFVLLCVAAAATGAATNAGMLTIQRTAGLLARDDTERVRIFSWLGVAPAFSNVLGPLAAGVVIDLAGFFWAYVFLLVLPLFTVATAWFIPPQPGHGQAEPTQPPALALLKVPGFSRLLVVNWLLATCWDVHTFAVPILGHQHGFSATVIGLVLATFTASVTLVRLVLPWWAHRLREVPVIRSAMLGTALVFALYPLAHTPWLMALCAAALGLTLGAVQPMVMSTLHHLTPQDRHGQALAFRSMAINGSSTVMPILFGAAGAALGAGVMFWAVGVAVGAGALLTGALQRRLASAKSTEP